MKELENKFQENFISTCSIHLNAFLYKCFLVIQQKFNPKLKILKLNRLYFKHLRKSLLVVIVGLVLILKFAYPDALTNVNLYILIMSILASFFGLIGIILLMIRLNRGVKFRRKFMYCFLGVASFVFSLISLPVSLLHRSSIVPIFIFLVGLMVGLLILNDIFFGKRESKMEQEMLVS